MNITGILLKKSLFLEVAVALGKVIIIADLL